MSIPIAQINLASVSVGSTGIISFASAGISAGGVSANPAHTKGAGTVHIFNESGSGLIIAFKTSGDSFFLPAGGWTDKQVRAGESGMAYTVIYNLPNPPVTLLLVTYYSPHEPIPYVPTLGNSPIGIGGTITTTNVSNLSNETNAVQTLIIDIGQTGNTLLITINSDGSFVWKVLQSGVAHQVLKAQISGNPLLIGQAGDISEVLGKLTVDQLATLTAGLTSTGGVQTITGNGLGSLHLGQSATGDTIDTTAGGTINLNAPTGQTISSKINSSTIIFVDQNGLTLSSGRIALLGGQLSRLNGSLSSCGSGTVISHGLGASPSWVAGTPWGSQPFSATVGVDNNTSTTLTWTIGAGSQIVWVAGV